MTTAPDWPQVIDISERRTGQPRLVLTRLSAVGDCIQTLPLASALRTHWPGAHLTWVVEKGAAPIVALSQAIDRLIVLPKGFARSPGMLFQLRKLLRREPVDIALDPQGLTKSGLVAWLSGARRRIGFARPAAREFNPWFQTDLVTSRALHRVERYLELLRPLGLEPLPVEFGLAIPAAATNTASAFVAREQLQGGYVVLNPGAGWDSKRWPTERYAELARLLDSQGVRCVVTWGGNMELELAQSIVAQSPGRCRLAPPTSLVELAAILRAARLFVGSDTGPLHLAAALGTPCVALFGASEAAACGPYGPGHIVVQQALDRSPGRKRSGADNWAMRQISTEAAYAACQAALERTGRVRANGRAA